MRVHIRGLKILVFREILRTYLMDDPFPFLLFRGIQVTPYHSQGALMNFINAIIYTSAVN